MECSGSVVVQSLCVGGGVGWKVVARFGPFNSYLQINFGSLTQVTAVTLTNPTSGSVSVTSFRMQFSNDAINWVNGATVCNSSI